MHPCCQSCSRVCHSSAVAVPRVRVRACPDLGVAITSADAARRMRRTWPPRLSNRRATSSPRRAPESAARRTMSRSCSARCLCRPSRSLATASRTRCSAKASSALKTSAGADDDGNKTVLSGTWRAGGLAVADPRLSRRFTANPQPASWLLQSRDGSLLGGALSGVSEGVEGADLDHGDPGRRGPVDPRRQVLRHRAAPRSRSCRRCQVGPTLSDRLAGDDDRSLPVEPGKERLGQRLLLGSSTGRIEELEGVLLRVVRRRQHHHSGQASRLAVADGVVGTRLRAQRVVDAGSPSAHGGCHGRDGVRHRPPMVHPRCRAHRRGRDGTHAGRGADVPVQQPRCLARPAHDVGGLHRAPGRRGRSLPLVRPHRSARRVRVPDQAAPGDADRPRLRPRSPDHRELDPLASDPWPARRRRGDAPRRWVVGRHR